MRKMLPKRLHSSHVLSRVEPSWLVSVPRYPSHSVAPVGRDLYSGSHRTTTRGLKRVEAFHAYLHAPKLLAEFDRPRLLCAECLPTDELKALQQALLNAFGRKDDKPFQPHVTLVRMQRGGRAAAGKSEMDRELSLVQAIDSVELFLSRTQADKGYQNLASLPSQRLAGGGGTFSARASFELQAYRGG